MELTYPIQAILLYVAMIFAPADVDQVTLSGFPDGTSIELVRTGEIWEADGMPLSIVDGNIVVHAASGKETLPLSEFIASPEGHRWAKTPTFTLSKGTTLEKTQNGFTLRRDANDKTTDGVYKIEYIEGETATVEQSTPTITINILGEVRNPGVYQISTSGTLIDAVAAAGGWTEKADTEKVSLVRGTAGEVPKVFKFDLSSILNGKAAAPAVHERDTLYVTKKAS